MTAERWKRISGVFEEALSLPAGPREAFVDEQTAGDDELRDVVRRMLAAEGEDAGYLETPALSMPASRLGSWRTIEEIGRGGMGVVFLGERADGLYEQKVAIKITPGSVHTESSLLARLEHPAIARLLDAGATPEGFPFLVMEFVDGLPVDEWIRRTRPSEKERLRVFLEICGAVQYAHRNLVLHRDLKPSNVLVTSDGQPKLLDFGIAKALDGPAAVTEFRAATPEYASPEQLSGERLTTASDVFSLGLLLYAILAGKPLNDFRGLSAREALQLASSGQSGKVEIKGDLGQVIRKAIQPEPAGRYGSVAELAEEIRRYEQGQPVQAQPPTFSYRAHRFLLRNKGKLGVAATVTLALASATALALWQARIAERRFAQTQELASSVLYELHDGIAGLPGSNPTRLLLSKRALRYLERLSAEAGSDVAIWTDVASGYLRLGDVQGGSAVRNLGQYKEAEESYRKAHEIATRLLAADPGNRELRKLSLRTERPVIVAAMRGAERKQALAASERHLEQAEQLLAGKPGDPATRHLVADAHYLRANAYLNNAMHDSTLPAMQRALELYEALPPATYLDRRRISGIHQYLCDEYLRRKDPAAARRHVELAVSLQEQAVRDFPDLISARMDLSLCHFQAAQVLAAEGSHREAVAALDRMIPIREQLVREEPSDVVGRAWLAAAHVNRGQYLDKQSLHTAAAAALEAGLSQYLDLLEIEKTSQRYQVTVAESEALLASVYGKLSRPARSCELYRSASRRLGEMTEEARNASRNPAAMAEVAKALERCAM